MDIINCICRYPYHIGRQHESLPPTMPTGVSLKYQLLPQVRLDTSTLGHSPRLDSESRAQIRALYLGIRKFQPITAILPLCWKIK